MISEDYCSFEVAKLLKEKGFQQLKNNCGYFTTEMVYSIDTNDNGEHHFAHQYPAGVYDNDNYIAAPTHQMAMKWLREVHNIMITIIPQEVNVGVDRMCYAIYRITEDLYQPLCNGKVDNLVDSYEDSVEAALKYCLENLI